MHGAGSKEFDTVDQYSQCESHDISHNNGGGVVNKVRRVRTRCWNWIVKGSSCKRTVHTMGLVVGVYTEL